MLSVFIKSVFNLNKCWNYLMCVLIISSKVLLTLLKLGIFVCVISTDEFCSRSGTFDLCSALNNYVINLTRAGTFDVFDQH